MRAQVVSDQLVVFIVRRVHSMSIYWGVLTPCILAHLGLLASFLTSISVTAVEPIGGLDSRSRARGDRPELYVTQLVVAIGTSSAVLRC